MGSKQCSVCSGLGYRDFVGGTIASTESCHSCDGTGRVRIADPAESPNSIKKRTKNPKPVKGLQTKQDVKAKNIKLVVSIVVFVAVYMFSKKHITDSFLGAAGIALVSYFIMYRWFYAVMTFILIAGIVLFFFGDNIFSFIDRF